MKSSDEHLTLIGRYLDGQATSEEVAELEALMLNDQLLRSEFLACARVDAALPGAIGNQGSIDKIPAGSSPSRVNRPRLFNPPLVAAAIVILGLFAWFLFSDRYPDPEATGGFEVVGGGPVERDSTLVTQEEPAQVRLGGYCDVTVEPKSKVTLVGETKEEGIKLEEGAVVCEVEPGQGKFEVQTDLGTVSVIGTKFEVELIQEKNELNMKTKQMLVSVLAGAVVVTTANGEQTTLQAGEKKIVSDSSDPFTKGGYELQWSDEFDVDGPPNPKNWAFEEGFVRNNEAQYYQKENAVCKDGMLYITGREDIKRNPGYVKGSTLPAETKFIEYTSSSLMTKGLHSWTMGRFVMRAKIPHGEGMWPAFWTVGEKGQWPSNGEIDIMEYYQDKFLANVVSGTKDPWKGNWSSKKYKTEDLGGQKWLDEFHVWRMDWDTESIRLYVDDKLLNERKLADTNNAHTKWGPKNPFHYPQFIIINLALGGDNGGDMEKAKIPADYIIDYVRVYQTKQDKSFKPDDDWVAPPPYTGKKIGIHHFSELPKTLNKKCSWANGADSRCYSWKPPGRNRESADMKDDYNEPFEGSMSYKFTLNHSWSRWMIEMDPKYSTGVADLSKFKKMGFALQSKDAAGWEKFRVIIESADGKSYEASLQDLGFKPDGKWHQCFIDLNKVKQAGVDLKKIRTLFAIAWEDGVKNGDYFKLDDLHVE